MYLTAVQGLSVMEILPKGSEWSEDFRDFLRMCFKLDPSQRPSAPVLLQVCNLLLIVQKIEKSKTTR